MDIDKILQTLWDIRNDDKFYFDSYGKQIIRELLIGYEIFLRRESIDSEVPHNTIMLDRFLNHL